MVENFFSAHISYSQQVLEVTITLKVESLFKVLLHTLVDSLRKEEDREINHHGVSVVAWQDPRPKVGRPLHLVLNEKRSILNTLSFWGVPFWVVAFLACSLFGVKHF